MLLDKGFQTLIDRMFPTPVDYDSLVAELGETPGEPCLVFKAFRAGQLVYYVNYDIKGADS